MSSGVKRKTHDEIYSMFLVPKRLYYSLMKNIEDDETKKELISMNEKPNTANYIENAINFKNLRDRQKMNQAGDKLYRLGSEKCRMLCHQLESIAVRVARTNLFQDQQPLKLPNKKKIPHSFCPVPPLSKGNLIQNCFLLLEDQKARTILQPWLRQNGEVRLLRGQ